MSEFVFGDAVEGEVVRGVIGLCRRFLKMLMYPYW